MTDELKDQGNVIRFARNVPSKARTNAEPKKPRYSIQKLQRLIAETLMGLPQQGLPLPPRNIIGIPVGKGRKIGFFDQEEKSYQFLDTNEAMGFIAHYLDMAREKAATFDFDAYNFELEPSRRKSLIDDILQRSTPFKPDEFATLGWLDDPRNLALRFPFNPEPCSWQDVESNAPFTAELLQRMDEPEVFARWIYETLDGHGNRKQCLWLWGESNALKSSVVNAIGAAFGPAFGVLGNRHFEESYSYLGGDLLGKRLVLVDEAKAKILRNEIFKAVTGASTFQYNQKFEAPFEYNLTARFVFTSNEAPSASLRSQDELASIANRILPIRVRSHPNAPEGTEWKKWMDSIRLEIRWLIGYGLACPKITVGRENQQKLIESNPIWEFTDLFEHDEFAKIPAANLREWARNKGLTSDNSYAELKHALRIAHGAREERINNARFIVGVRHKN